MTGLHEIGVLVQPAPANHANHAAAQAVLKELEASLDVLLKTGKEHSIDLRSLPLSPSDLEYLKATLGSGEVRVEVNALGRSDVLETGIRGVWWVTHHNSLDAVMAEFLEVSFCPDIIRAQHDDVRESLDQLSTRLCSDGNH